MLDLNAWQLIVVVIVAAATLGGMFLVLVRLFSRRASGKATLRKATAVECGLVGGVVPEGVHVFDGWSFRVGARFAGCVRVTVFAPDEFGREVRFAIDI